MLPGSLSCGVSRGIACSTSNRSSYRAPAYPRRAALICVKNGSLSSVAVFSQFVANIQLSGHSKRGQLWQKCSLKGEDCGCHWQLKKQDHFILSGGLQPNCSLQLRRAYSKPGLCNTGSISASSRVSLRNQSSNNTRFRVEAKETESPASVDFGVFRFTLGIPGFDDAKLPRAIGVLFGVLLVLNHAASTDFISMPQWRSEAVGMALATLAIALPSLDDRLNASRSFGRACGGSQHLFLNSSLRDNQRAELAWGSYALLQNSNATAVLVWAAGKLVCSRGLVNSLYGIISENDLENMAEEFSGYGGPPRGRVIKRGAVAFNALIQPLEEVCEGFLLVLADETSVYNEKDRKWVQAMATKFSAALALSVAASP